VPRFLLHTLWGTLYAVMLAVVTGMMLATIGVIMYAIIELDLLAALLIPVVLFATVAGFIGLVRSISWGQEHVFK
jgi:hypothetical protein